MGIVNFGGTLTCLRIEDYIDDTEGVLNRSALLNKDGEFDVAALEKKKLQNTPVQSESELENILSGALGFAELETKHLLEKKVIYHKPQDSSQMLDPDREAVLPTLEQEYQSFDGFIVIHGTDTAAHTARFLHIALPHYDPRELALHDRSVHNWTKPLLIVSSQEPAARFRDGKFIPLVGSDAGQSIVTAITTVIDDRFGEVGCLVNREFVYRGTAYDKGSESHFEFLAGDKGIPALAQRTAFGITFTGPSFDERPLKQDRTPFVIYGSASYERSVVTVSQIAHLQSCQNYLDAVNEKNKDAIDRLRKTLPRAILYVSKGAGNVQKDEYDVLEALGKLEGDCTQVMRVPLRGGRVPREMHYDVPGGEIPGFNIEYATARYKAQGVLALMDQLKIPPTERKAFFSKMMEKPFAREFLPYT